MQHSSQNGRLVGLVVIHNFNLSPNYPHPVLSINNAFHSRVILSKPPHPARTPPNPLGPNNRRRALRPPPRAPALNPGSAPTHHNPRRRHRTQHRAARNTLRSARGLRPPARWHLIYRPRMGVHAAPPLLAETRRDAHRGL